MAISLGILTQHFQTNPYVPWVAQSRACDPVIKFKFIFAGEIQRLLAQKTLLTQPGQRP